MEIIGKGVLYKNQYGWSISDNQKQQDGTVNRFYIPVSFKKGLEEPQDKSYVSIKGFTKPYKTKDDKTGISYFIMEYELVGETKEEQKENDQYEEYANEVQLTDEDLPF